MDKYYTPEMEEFCIGFEYDEKYIANTDNPEWISKVATYRRDGKYSINEGCIEDIPCDNGNGWAEYRVKYLDKADIESLGFEYDPRMDIDCYTRGNYNLFWFHSGGIISIDYSSDHHTAERFQGSIKNKSELSRLLKQLNITK